MDFKNKVALVTGGSSGIGASTAILFAQNGADVVIVGRNESKLKDITKKVTAAGKAPLAIIADLSKDGDVKKVIDETFAKFGKIDILVNNAGMTKYGSLLDGKAVESYDVVFEINLRSLIHLTMLATPHLVKTKGCVVNISSVAGIGRPRVPASMIYGSSKAALNYFSTAAASELAPKGVRVNCICPGPVRTDFSENAGNSISWDSLKDVTALSRISEPEEIGKLILYLCSDDAAGMTGSNITLDNGYLMKL